jgi:hypothetical protein
MHLDLPLQQIVEAEIGVACLELVTHVRDDGGRTERLQIVRYRRGQQPRLGPRQLFARDDGRDTRVRRNLAVLRGELDQRLAVRVVDVADGWKLKTCEWSNVRQILPTEVDVVQRTVNKMKTRRIQRDARDGLLPAFAVADIVTTDGTLPADKNQNARD